MNKKKQRQRRALRTRSSIRRQRVYRLSVHKTNSHTYAQLVSPCGDKVIACASTLDKDLRSQVKHGGNIEAAVLVGKTIAERIKAAGIEKVAFDRSGFKYHGRVKALADAARESGVDF